jgi:DedD protein
MAESEQALQLKRRARRRLVGAIALVTFVIIILPLLLDKEPAPSGTSLSVQIPKQDSGNFNNRVSPPLPALGATEGKAGAPAAKADAAGPKAESAAGKPEAPKPGADAATVKEASASLQRPSASNPSTPVAAGKIASVPADGKSEEARAQAALNDQAWVVALGSFSSADNVKQLQARLSAAGVKSYTEPLKTAKGEQTRVRAGPFASKEAADKAHGQIAAMGLKPGSVTKR